MGFLFQRSALRTCLTMALFSIMGADAFSAGFEKTILWGGRHAGLGGAGVAGMQGSEMLFFNPAGLLGSKDSELTLNFSPTFIDISGPFAQNGGTSIFNAEGKQQFLPVASLMYSKKLSDSLAVGAGIYVSGGNRVRYENVAISTASGLKPNVATQFDIIEYSAGAAYEVASGFRIGASYRVVTVGGEIITPYAAFSTPAGNAVQSLGELRLSELSATRWNGFRLGAQYDGDGWGLGITGRSAVDFIAEGRATAREWTGSNIFTKNGAPGDQTATVRNKLPLQVNTGFYVDAIEKELRIFGEHSFNQYSGNDEVTFGGTLSGTNIGRQGVTNLVGASIRQDWSNFHIFRLGTEYAGLKFATLRAGYARTTQMTPPGFARPSFTPPGDANSFTLGAGKLFMDNTIELNLALEYSQVSGTVTREDVALTGTSRTVGTGEYKASAYAAHLGMSYRF